MKRLFVCCDGTWNSDSDEFQGVPVPTNDQFLSKGWFSAAFFSMPEAGFSPRVRIDIDPGVSETGQPAHCSSSLPATC